VDGFKILGVYPEAADARIALQAQCDVTRKTFDELGIVVGTFGDMGS
jgi:hypothetical protein